MCPSPPLDASVPTARAKRYDLVAGCYPANATEVPLTTVYMLFYMFCLYLKKVVSEVIYTCMEYCHILFRCAIVLLYCLDSIFC